MSDMINFNAQIAPMEHVEKVVRHGQEHSQVTQQALLQKASQTLSKDNEQVQRGAAGKHGKKVERHKGDDHDDASAYRSPKKRAGKNPQEEQPDGEIPDFSPDVWSGNIVNVKV